MTALPASPTPEHVARAIVDAARLTGDDPIEVARGGHGGRARYYAANALYLFFPQVVVRLIAQYVGVSGRKSREALRTNIVRARQTEWWDAAAAEAVCKAVWLVGRVASVPMPAPATKPRSLIDAAAQRAPVQKPSRLIEAPMNAGIVPLGEPAPGRSALDEKRRTG